VIGLRIFPPVFEVGNGLTTKAGQIGQLSNAQTFTLPEYAEIGNAMGMMFFDPLLRGMWFHLILSFEVQAGPSIFSAPLLEIGPSSRVVFANSFF
jgi:hypothetical protein